jgi:DNA polymerase-3 subunit alpha
VFDEEPCSALEGSAKAGGCGLLTVELDRRAGDEAPRVSVKRFQSLDGLAQRTRLQMTVRVSDAREVALIAPLFADVRRGTGALRFVVPLSGGGEASMLAGRDFQLDGELVARIERVTGEGSVDLSVQEPPKLALVG